MVFIAALAVFYFYCCSKKKKRNQQVQFQNNDVFETHIQTGSVQMSEVNPHYNQSNNVIHGSVQVVEVEAEPLPRSIKLG